MTRRLVTVLLSVIAIPMMTTEAATQGRAKFVTLNNVSPSGAPEAGASGRVVLFEGTHAVGNVATMETTLKSLFCRSGGRDPIDPNADQLGGAFYALYLSTSAHPVPTRLHIFNTDCSTASYQGSYNLYTYLARTNQSEDDVLLSPITLEIRLERDQDGDGIFEQNFTLLRGSQ